MALQAQVFRNAACAIDGCIRNGRINGTRDMLRACASSIMYIANHGDRLRHAEPGLMEVVDGLLGPDDSLEDWCAVLESFRIDAEMDEATAGILGNIRHLCSDMWAYLRIREIDLLSTVH